MVLCFFHSAKLLGAPRTLGAPGLCPAQLIGCDATVVAVAADKRSSDALIYFAKLAIQVNARTLVLLRAYELLHSFSRRYTETKRSGRKRTRCMLLRTLPGTDWRIYLALTLIQLKFDW